MTPNAADPPRRVGFAKAALYVILMGLLIGWLAALAMPLAIQWEIPQPIVDRIPYAGLFIGAILGLAMALAEPIRQFVWFLFGAVAVGLVLWLFVVVFVGLGLTLVLDDEAFDRAMDRVSAVTFWLLLIATGIAAPIGAYVFVHDKAGAMLERFRPKGRKAP